MSGPLLPLPYLFEPVADLLLADPLFESLIPGGIGPKAPAAVDAPFAVMRVSASPLGGKGTAWRATAALNGCAAGWVGTTSPEQITWDIAAAAAAVFDRAVNRTVGRISYTGRVTDGPFPLDVDTSRGEATPLYGAQVRAELTIHLR